MSQKTRSQEHKNNREIPIVRGSPTVNFLKKRVIPGSQILCETKRGKTIYHLGSVFSR
jgi:hypothetical protein